MSQKKTEYPISMPVIEAMYERESSDLFAMTIGLTRNDNESEDIVESGTEKYFRSLIALKSAIRAVSEILREHARGVGIEWYASSHLRSAELVTRTGNLESEIVEATVVDNGDYVTNPQGKRLQATIGSDALAGIIEKLEQDSAGSNIRGRATMNATSGGDSNSHLAMEICFTEVDITYKTGFAAMDFTRGRWMNPKKESLHKYYEKIHGEKNTLTEQGIAVSSAVASYMTRFLMYPGRMDAERFTPAQ